MSKVEFHILDGWYREMEKMVPIDFILYLRIDPEVCLKRIKTRGRIEERDISLVRAQTGSSFSANYRLEHAKIN